MASATGREVICTDQHDSPPSQMISQIHLQLFIDIWSSMDRMSLFDLQLILSC